MLCKNIMKTKTVSVWGLGYLGYTMMLKLQNSGFDIIAYDISPEQLKLFSSGKYPNREQVATWSKTGYLPKLNYNKIKIAKKPAELFKSSHLHIITSPEFHRVAPSENVTSKIADLFYKNMKKTKISPLVIFESASIPGHIEKHFVRKLKNHNLLCSRNYYLTALLRTDWSIEAFVTQKGKMPIAGHCSKSVSAAKKVFDYLNISTITLNNLKEAELYLNATNAIQAMANDFIRQLSLGYPSDNVKAVSDILFGNISLKDCILNIGTGGERMTFAIDNLIKGSDNPGSLTLLKEFQDINISSVLSYGEYIMRHAYKSVTILGITYKGNQRDLTLSPSITLADYLIKNSVRVFVNDPFFTNKEIHNFINGAKVVDFPEDIFSTDVLVVASGHNEYRYLSQATINKIKKSTKLIIDNYGIWSHLSFGKKIKYHKIGDGKLNILK